jgi:hypothetical protein
MRQILSSITRPIVSNYLTTDTELLHSDLDEGGSNVEDQHEMCNQQRSHSRNELRNPAKRHNSGDKPSSSPEQKAVHLNVTQLNEQERRSCL